MPLASEDSAAAVVVELVRRLAERDARIVELEALVLELRARLDQNSRNSSKPPSSDGYAKPEAEKDGQKDGRDRGPRRRSGRKPGGQEGHEGSHLERREDPDRAVPHRVEVCDCCGRDLTGTPIVESRSRQVFDLPEMPGLECVAHWIQKRRCECGNLASSEFPAEATAPACYGPRVRALGIYLVSYQHLPYERAAEILSDWVKAPISVGTLRAFITQGAAGLEGFLEEIRGQLADAEVAHFDETGGRVAGKLHWIHSASTDLLTLLSVHRKRGVEAMDHAGAPPHFGGVAAHDGWAPYRSYENSPHALCGAQHLRELTAAQEAGQMWALAMTCLLVDTKDAVEQAKADGRKRLSKKALAQLHASYREVITMGHEENRDLAQIAGRRPKRTKAQNPLLRLDERETEALRFATDFRVPFDNNLAERDIRMVKLQQKISGCWRATDGAERFLQIRSYLSTARKHGQRPIDALSALTAGQPWLPAARSG